MSTYIIRCGTPDSDWGFPVVDPLNIAEKCYEEFREHCVERHDLKENDTDAQVLVNFKGILYGAILHSARADSLNKMKCPYNADATHFAPKGKDARKRNVKALHKHKCRDKNRQGIFLCERCAVDRGVKW